MPDTTKTNIENQDAERKNKRSFFWGSLNEKAKDFLDFRYNTQEEIDKFNEEMQTNKDLNNVINDGIEETEEWIIKENKVEEVEEAENNLENNLNEIDEPIDLSTNDYSWEIDNNDKEENMNIYENNDQTIDWNDTLEIDYEDSENNQTNEWIIHEDSEEIKVTDDLSTDLFDNNNSDEEENQQNSKFFDPFELDLDNYDEEEKLEENSMFDPFWLNEEENNENNNIEDDNNILQVDDESENENSKDNKIPDENNENQDEEYDEVQSEDDDSQDEEYGEVQSEDDDSQNEEYGEVQSEDDENQDEEYDEVQSEDDEDQDEEYDEVQSEDDEDQDEEYDEDNQDDITISTPIPINPNQKDENEKSIKEKKIKKNSTTWEIVTDEEIELEQWQDIPVTEDDEEYQPSAEEIFEQEPEFFADDDLSQQFLHLAQNVRWIFKLEYKDGEKDPYFKIIWWKNNDYTTEYLFYLIEEENEPVDLYIKKVETNQAEEENEHLVQFSYNEDKELNIFVDEMILYEKINKSNSNSIEYNDTKAILEKFIFLTENHYDKLKDEIKKQHEEEQKKRQLQQIFKGF